MDSPNTHPIPDEEEEEVLTDTEELTDNSDASDYEWGTGNASYLE